MTHRHPPSRRRAAGPALALALALAAPAVAAQDGAAGTGGVLPPVLREPPRPAATPAPVVVRGWKIPVSSVMSLEELEALTAPLRGQPLDDARRKHVVDTVRARYEARGLGLVGVALRLEPGGTGTVALLIVEPRLARVDIASMEGPPVSDARILGMLAHQGLNEGALLDLDALDQVMFGLNDLPGTTVKARLAPTGDDGRFELSLERAWRPQFEGSVDLDNQGSVYNGRHRVGAFVRWSNPSGEGDNLDARLMVSQGGGLGLGRVGYERPLGVGGWRGSAGVSSVSYDLAGALAALEPRGRATVLDLALSRPLVRARERNLVLRLGLEHKRLQDRFDAVDVRTDKHADNLLATLSLEQRDGWRGGGFTGASAALVAGRLVIDTAADRASDEALGRRGTGGGFVKLTLQGSRLQALAPGWSLFGAGTLQWASRNLDSAEKLALGGAQAVRAYPAGEAAADAGLLLSAELRRAVGKHWSVFGLIDHGRARLQMRPLEGAENTRSLSGVGVGAFFSDPEWFTLRASLALRGGEVPASEPDAGRARLFFQLQKSF